MVELADHEGNDHVAKEVFYPLPPIADLLRQPTAPPRYEFYGEARQSNGIYDEVIRWHHVNDLILKLMNPQPLRTS